MHVNGTDEQTLAMYIYIYVEDLRFMGGISRFQPYGRLTSKIEGCHFLAFGRGNI
jgi:hypothetical protein